MKKKKKLKKKLQKKARKEMKILDGVLALKSNPYDAWQDRSGLLHYGDFGRGRILRTDLHDGSQRQVLIGEFVWITEHADREEVKRQAMSCARFRPFAPFMGMARESTIGENFNWLVYDQAPDSKSWEGGFELRYGDGRKALHIIHCAGQDWKTCQSSTIKTLFAPLLAELEEDGVLMPAQ